LAGQKRKRLFAVRLKKEGADDSAPRVKGNTWGGETDHGSKRKKTLPQRGGWGKKLEGGETPNPPPVSKNGGGAEYREKGRGEEFKTEREV